MRTSINDQASEATFLTCVVPGGIELSARFEGSKLVVFASDECWKRAPDDAKAAENGARFLLVEIDGVQRVGHVESTGRPASQDF